MSPPRSINFTTISQYYFYNKEGWSAAVDLKRIVVGQLPPYNRPQTQGPILILALNTDRSRRWSNAGEWRIDQLAALSPRHAAAFLVCSTFQPTKNQTFITLRHVRRCNIYICDFVPRARFFVVLFLQLSGWQSCNVDPFRSIGVAYIRVLICMLVWNIDRSCVMYILLYKYCWSEKRNYGIRIKS